MSIRALRIGMGSGILKIILSIFVILMVGGLVFMDLGGIFSASGKGNIKGPNTVLAKVDGQTITARDLVTILAPFLEQSNMTVEQASELGLTRMALDNAITDRLARRAAAHLGIQVPDAPVAQMLAEQLRSIAPPNSDMKSILEAILRKNGITEEELTQQVRTDLALQILGTALTVPEVNMPSDALVRDMYTYENEERDIDLILFRSAAAAEPGPAPEDALRALYKAQKDTAFAVQEQRVLLLAEITDADKTSLAAKADALDEALLSGQSLESITKEQNLTLTTVESIDEGGKGPGAQTLTKVLSEQDAREILSVAFKLKEGESSAVLELPGPRFMAVEVMHVKPRGSKPFEDVKKDLETQWVADARLNTAKEQAQKALKALEDGKTTLEDISKQKGNGAGPVREVRALTRNASALPLPLVPEAMDKIFATPVEKYALVELPQGPAVFRIVSARLPKETAIKKEALDAMRQSLIHDMTAETLALYIEAQRKQASITLYPERLEALHAKESPLP